MTATLKQKTVSGLIWSFTENIANHGVTFIVGIILARLLSPQEFGLIGMITIFIAISTSVINSGFSQALIRKNNCTQTDFSTVFYFNLLVGAAMFALLAISAPLISRFFEEPQLIPLIRVLSVVLIIDSVTIIQRTILTKNINFKLQTKISAISSILSGIIGIVMAYNGFGVWSLVARQIAGRFFNSLLLWFWNKWKPLWIFSKDSFHELFNFGYKLLIAGLIQTLYRNIYYAIIGKFFSAAELGYYTRAEGFNQLPSQNITSVVQRVTFPVLASIQDDLPRLKIAYKKLIRSTVLITFTLMLGMAAVAEPLILTLVGEKWRTSILYLQMLSFVGMMYPLQALNLNMLNVQGRSDLVLKLQVIKRILAIPTIVAGVIWGMEVLIAGLIVNTLIAYYLNSYWSGKFLNYPAKEQIYDIFPFFSIALINAFLVYIIGQLLPYNHLMNLIIQILAGGILAVGMFELFKFESYIELKRNILLQISRIIKIK